MKVGDTIYTFDGNRRVYERVKGGGYGGHGRAIYSEHFRPFKILSENEKEFLCEHSATINKRSGMMTWGRDKYRIFTEAEREDMIWLNTHRHKIREAVDKSDAATLRKVADLIGYKP